VYGRLAELTSSPVVELNRAVAVGFASGPEAGLVMLDAIAGDPRLAQVHLLAATRADLLRRLGRHADATDAYRRALDLVRTAPERRFLESRLDDLTP
jgi:RNA polymerase sigma-70 factor (ECF subfamily)